MVKTFREWIARKLGVGLERKTQIYLDLSKSTTLSDPSYWLQTLFAAGIATLGLVLNSPAVIIGAMLISPLMGPILATGLALATGDMILALRSALNLALSCLLAVGFAFLLVTVLPFKEITHEIAVRVHPNILDLAVALFSGAIGSIATCKEVKGVVTSIPGVAIAVALMPPLGVVGYGLAICAGIGVDEGMRVALGGGLLFLTNLVAITFTAMLVFLALHIDVPAVKDQMEEWHRGDRESVRLRNLLSRLPGVPGVRHIGTLPARVLMIVVLILAIMIPLSRSFNQLRAELSEQKQENKIRQLVSQTWQKEFGKLSNGESRSFIDRVSVTERDGRLNLQLRVLTIKPLVAAEKEQFNRALATSLARAPNTLQVQILEIPTASAAELRQRAIEEKNQIRTVDQLQQSYNEQLTSALGTLPMPPPAKLIDYQIVNRPPNQAEVLLSYLSERDIELDAQALIVQDVRTRLNQTEANVRLERIPLSLGQLRFTNGELSRDQISQQTLDLIGKYLGRFQNVILFVVTPSEQTPTDALTNQRIDAVKNYFASNWEIAGDRIVPKPNLATGKEWVVELGLKE
jgi:uncharacterized hydrophobic protein (TIGR00271 family)